MFSSDSGGKKSLRWAALFLAAAVGMVLAPVMNQPLNAAVAQKAEHKSIVELVKEVSPAVVSITTEIRMQRPGMPGPFGQQQQFNEFWRRFFENPNPGTPYQRQSAGSGFIIDPSGLILTNYHVIANASKIVVGLSDESQFDAKVIGSDEKTDIALLKIDAGHPLPAVVLGDSDRLETGEAVLAIGNPFGLEHTVTSGIVSAKGRHIGAGPYDNFIQTDASINPGNSGGPLINARGEVIGVNTAIFSRSGGNIGIGFAIPINLVKDIITPLKNTGHVTRGWLGVTIQRVTPALAESLGLSNARGALVADVSANSPAQAGEIQRGDVILEFNGKVVEQSDDLPMLVASTPIGKTVPVKVYRNGAQKTLSVRIGELKEETVAASTRGSQDLGLTVQDITPEMADSLGMTRAEGVVVTAVEPDSPAADAGLRQGDVILEVNKAKIAGMVEYHKAIAQIKKDETALFLVQRGGTTLFFAAKNVG
jgi:serine protease Do